MATNGAGSLIKISLSIRLLTSLNPAGSLRRCNSKGNGFKKKILDLKIMKQQADSLEHIQTVIQNPKNSLIIARSSLSSLYT